jgi:uncharacterized protein (TIGR02246 family)
MHAEASMGTAGLGALLERFARAVAARDSAGFASLFTRDGRYHDGFFGVHDGRDAIAAMLERFYVGGEAFFWQFFDPAVAGDIGYARYVFSYRSRQPDSAGQVIVFEGIAQLRLRGGLIAEYDEAFDRGIAFTQLGYDTARIGKLLGRYSGEFTASPRARAHLAARPPAASPSRSGDA